MRILFARVFESYYDKSVPAAFRKLGHEVEEITYFTPQDPYQDEKLEEMLEKNLRDKAYDTVFTVNFWPLIGKVCAAQGLPYIAWSYDCPQNLPDNRGMKLESNHIFLFDRSEVERYRKEGASRVFHMPLATDVDGFEQRLSNTYSGKRKFTSDISLLGSLYTTASMPAILQNADDYTQGYLRGILRAQQTIYGYWMIPDLLTEEKTEEIRKALPDSDLTREKTAVMQKKLAFAAAEYLTYQDRLLLMRIAAGKSANVALYTWKITEDEKKLLPGIDLRPAADYHTEMPYVFQGSKINLCPTLRCIGSGIPLRALDIMACGGLLMTPVQPELLEYFVPNQDAIIYSSMEEAADLMSFYLQHEDAMELLRKNGREKIRAAFRMEDRLQMILDQVFC